MGKKINLQTIIIILSILIISTIFYFLVLKNDESSELNTQIANPASVFCIEQGNNLTIKTNQDGSQSGYCVSPSNIECEEWAFFRGECNLS